MKIGRLAVVLAIFSLGFLLAGKVAATEGRFSLTNGGVVCEGTSVWQDSSYRVMGRCQGLVYPYGGVLDHYSIWVRTPGDTAALRLDDVDRGFFEGRVQNSFESVFVTAEEESNPRRPGATVVAQGNVEEFDFRADEGEGAPQVTPSPTPVGTPTATPTPTPSGIGRVIGRIFTALVIIFLTLVGLVIVGSLIFRRRSVSG